MNFEEIFQYIGEIGLYQVILYVLLGLPSYFSGYMSISMSFLGYTPEHWCYIPRLEDFPYEIQKNVGMYVCQKMVFYVKIIYFLKRTVKPKWL